MSENVIDFPRSSRTAGKQALDEERRRRDEAHAQRIERRRLERTREQMTKRPMMHSVKERITVAQNLWGILGRLEEEHSISKKTVLHESGFGSGTDSTKRLPYFAIKPSLPESQKIARGGKLTKHIDKYDRIASTAATMCGKEPTAFLLDLVRGSLYAGTTDIEPDEDIVASESWEDITTVITTAESRIATKHGLRGYFDTIRDLQLTDTFLRLQSVAGRADSYRALEKKTWPGTVPSESLPPRPQVDLGMIRVCRDIPCTITLEPFSCVDDGERLLEPLVEAGLETTTLTGMATPVLNLWLEILPGGSTAGTCPVLRMEAVTYVRAMEAFRAFEPFGGTPIRKGDVLGTIKGSIERGENDVEQGSNEIIAAFEEGSEENEALWVSVAITAEFDAEPPDYLDTRHAQLTRLDSYVVPFGDEARSLLCKEQYSTGSDWKYCTATARALTGTARERSGGDDITAFGYRTMAAALERSLFDAPDPARLDRLLDAAAGKARADLAAAITGVRSRRQNRLAEILVEYGPRGTPER